MATKRLIITTPWTERILTLIQSDGISISGFTNEAIMNNLLPKSRYLRSPAEKLITEYSYEQKYTDEIFNDTLNLLESTLRWLGDHHIQSPDLLWEIFDYSPPDTPFWGPNDNDPYKDDFTDKLYEELEKLPNYRKPRNWDSRTLLYDLLANWKHLWDSALVYAYLEDLFVAESSYNNPVTPPSVLEDIEKLGQNPLPEESMGDEEMGNVDPEDIMDPIGPAPYPEQTPLQVVFWVKRLEEEYISENL